MNQPVIDLSKIREYDFKNLPEHATVMLVAKRRSGKTFMMRHIMHDIGDRFDYVYLMSETAELNMEHPYPFIHGINCRNFFDEKLIETIIADQKSKLMEEKLKEPKYRYVPRYCFILDDIIADNNLKQSNILKKLFIEGRHLYITLFLLSQSASKLASVGRVCFTNCDLCITFSITDFFTLDTISRDFASLLGHKMGQELLRTVTSERPFQAVVFENCAQNVMQYYDYVYKKTAKEYKDKDFKLLGRPDYENYTKHGVTQIPLAIGSKKKLNRLPANKTQKKTKIILRGGI